MARILYVPFDHLNFDFGVLKGADPASDVIAMVESQRMVTGRPWHKERLFFLIASARHFAAEARRRGFEVHYIQASSTIEGLKQIATNLVAESTFHCAEPSSFRQYQQLKDFGVEFVQNDFFMTTRKHFFMWAERQKTFVMENFYRAQRVRLGVLVNGSDPEGGRWNYDSENRLPPPKNYVWPPYLLHERDVIDAEVAAELNFEPSKTWATTRAGALAQLDNFITNHLHSFGPYEDAIAEDNWALHHSLLSPYLNNGLLNAREVIEAAVVAYESGAIAIQSVEAFIRQIIGWREYIHGMYWFLGESYREQNQLSANRQLLPLFTDSSKTRMNCVRSVVSDIETRAWAHHIPRLMVLSNLALTTGVNPQEFLDWMRENFVDANEWVMVPNIIGMATHADGGTLMTKPYAAGGAYLNRMTQHCKGCAYDPKKRIGDDACPFTTLYWDFLDRHKDLFAKNHRMSQQIAGLNRLGDVHEVRARAASVINGLEQGII